MVVVVVVVVVLLLLLLEVTPSLAALEIWVCEVVVLLDVEEVDVLEVDVLQKYTSDPRPPHTQGKNMNKHLDKIWPHMLQNKADSAV